MSSLSLRSVSSRVPTSGKILETIEHRRILHQDLITQPFVLSKIFEHVHHGTDIRGTGIESDIRPIAAPYHAGWSRSHQCFMIWPYIGVVRPLFRNSARNEFHPEWPIA